MEGDDQHELEQRGPHYSRLLVDLHQAADRKQWNDVVQLSEQVLAIAPQRSMEATPVTSIAIPVRQICRIAVAMVTDQVEASSDPETRLLGPRIADHGTTRRVVRR